MSLPHALLGLLADGPASGYDLRKRFDASLGYVWQATQSQLYAELARLSETGLIKARRAGPRRRREYELTAAGRQELTRWLTEGNTAAAQRNQTLLRVFFLWTLPRDAAQAYLADVAVRSRAFHQRLQQLAATIDISPVSAGFAYYGRLVLEHGLRASNAQADWAEWATRQLRSDTTVVDQ